MKNYNNEINCKAKDRRFGGIQRHLIVRLEKYNI